MKYILKIVAVGLLGILLSCALFSCATVSEPPAPKFQNKYYRIVITDTDSVTTTSKITKL